MKKIILKSFVGTLVSCLTILMFAYLVNARSGLTANSGDKLTVTQWNSLVSQFNALSGQVNTSTGRILVPNQGNWTSTLSCRRVGNVLQFNGYILNSTAQSFWGVSGFYLPSDCRPSYTIIYPAVACWNGGYNTGRCFFSLDSSGQLAFYTQDSMTTFSFAGIYSAN